MHLIDLFDVSTGAAVSFPFSFQEGVVINIQEYTTCWKYCCSSALLRCFILHLLCYFVIDILALPV